MIFEDIQAILMPELTVLSKFLNKPRISREERPQNWNQEKNCNTAKDYKSVEKQRCQNGIPKRTIANQNLKYDVDFVVHESNPSRIRI